MPSSDAMQRAAVIFKRKTLVPSGECLLYPQKPDAHGYGQINTGTGEVVKAHRVAWEIAHGSIGDSNVYVDHRCHNPRCVNVEHLRLASPGENLQNRKGATRASRTGFRGVYRKRGRFIAAVQIDGVNHRIASFATAEEAAVAAAELRRKLMPFSEMDRSTA